MATYYSSLYGAVQTRGYSAGVETVTTSYVYKGPHVSRYNEVTRVCGFLVSTGFAFASTDSLIICPAVTGLKVASYTLHTSADLDAANDFTFNLGFTGALTGILSASTGLQTGTALIGSGLTAAAATTDGNLILSAAAGALEVAGTLFFDIGLVRFQA